MLEINKLKISVDDKLILNGVDLKIEKGEIVCIMGPNGSGKSSLAGSVARMPKYKIVDGTIKFNKKVLNSFTASKVAMSGIFLAHQNPAEVSGIALLSFLFEIHKVSCRAKKKDSLSIFEFTEIVEEYMKNMKIDVVFLERSFNVGLSGGEKKKIEILQMLVLDPELIILDEIDSGLDVDALKIVGNVVSDFLTKEKSLIVITHYKRILKYIRPDKVVLLEDGVVKMEGGIDIANKIESSGFYS